MRWTISWARAHPYKTCGIIIGALATVTGAWQFFSDTTPLDASLALAGITVSWLDVSAGDVLSGLIILVFLALALMFFVIDARANRPYAVAPPSTAAPPSVDTVRQEDRRLREVAEEDYQQLGNRMIMTSRSVDYNNLNALAPYIDFTIEGINCTVYAVFIGKSIQGRVVMRGNGHRDVELQDPPRITEGGPGIMVTPHGSFRLRLRQPLTTEVAAHLLYERGNTFVSFSFDALEIEIEAETVVSMGRKVIGLSPFGGDVPHFGDLPSH
jgi:hypothetical protein